MTENWCLHQLGGMDEEDKVGRQGDMKKSERAKWPPSVPMKVPQLKIYDMTIKSCSKSWGRWLKASWTEEQRQKSYLFVTVQGLLQSSSPILISLSPDFDLKKWVQNVHVGRRNLTIFKIWEKGVGVFSACRMKSANLNHATFGQHCLSKKLIFRKYSACWVGCDVTCSHFYIFLSYFFIMLTPPYETPKTPWLWTPIPASYLPMYTIISHNYHLPKSKNMLGFLTTRKRSTP